MIEKKYSVIVRLNLVEKLHKHKHKINEYYYVVDGKGKLKLGNKDLSLKKNMFVRILK